jgi:hypothetical protein
VDDARHRTRDGHRGSIRTAARWVTIAALVGLAVGATGLLLGGWYEDDGCSKEEWKCDLGTLGIVLLWPGIAGVLMACVAALLWLLALLVGRR